MNIQGQWLGNIEAYCKAEQDNDYLYYWFMRSNVKPYNHNDSRLNALFKAFETLLKGGLYIKGNYLFFTLNKAQFYIKLSCFTDEWRNIQTIIDTLSQVDGVQDIAYLYGELD